MLRGQQGIDFVVQSFHFQFTQPDQADNKEPAPVLSGTTRLTSAYAGRIHGRFMNAREPLREGFGDMSPRLVENPQAWLDGIEAVYQHDDAHFARQGCIKLLRFMRPG